MDAAQTRVRLPGSCTACVAVLRPAPGVLEVGRAVVGCGAGRGGGVLVASCEPAVHLVCLSLSLSRRAWAQVANLGDSGLRLIRGGRMVGATAVQEHAFNMPYQLACPDEFPETDTAADAQVYAVRAHTPWGWWWWRAPG